MWLEKYLKSEECDCEWGLLTSIGAVWLQVQASYGETVEVILLRVLASCWMLFNIFPLNQGELNSGYNLCKLISTCNEQTVF